MRFKYYLRGCGLGILLTAIILTIGFHIHGGKELSDQDVMQRASELGMVMPDGEEEMGIPVDTESQTETEAAADGQENLMEDTENSNGDAEDEAEDEPSASETQKEEQDGDTVTIIVKKGEVCREIAEDLYEHGLVQDAEEFRKYMQESGYDNLIQVGEFELTYGMEYGQIAEILTTKQE